MRILGDTERCRCRWKTNMLCFVNAETPFWPQKWGPWVGMFVDQLGHWSHPIWQSHLRPWGSARWTNPTRKQHLNCAVEGTTPGIIKNSNKETSLGSSRSSCSRCRAHLRSKTSLRRSGFHFQAAIPLAEIEETPENVKSEVWQYKKSDVRQGSICFCFSHVKRMLDDVGHVRTYGFLFTRLSCVSTAKLGTLSSFNVSRALARSCHHPLD